MVSIKRAADGRRQRSREIIDETREKYRANNVWILAEHFERSEFCDFEKPLKQAHQKGKIESNEQSKEGGQLK